MEEIVDGISVVLLVLIVSPMLYLFSRANGERPLVVGWLIFLSLTAVNVLWSVGDSAEPIRYKIVRALALLAAWSCTAWAIKKQKNHRG